MVLLIRRLSPRLISFSMKLAVLFLAGYLAEILLIQDEHLRLVATDITSPLINLFTVAALLLAASSSHQKSKRIAIAWGICCLAQVVYLAGDLTWMIREAGLDLSPYPSLADVFYVLYYPILFVGILLLSQKRDSRGERIKRALDLSVTGIASLLFFTNFLIVPSAAATVGEDFISRVLALAYPTGDLFILWVLLALLYNSSDMEYDVPILLLWAGALALVVTDVIFSVQSQLGTYVSGGLLDIGWTVFYVLFGLAGVTQAVSAQPGAVLSRPLHSRFLSPVPLKKFSPAVPYLLAAGAFALLIYSYLTPVQMGFLPIAGGVSLIIGLVLLRQIVTLSENSRLFKDLHLALERVQTQAAELEKSNAELQNEIAERKRMERQLAHDALHDGLTFLPNRTLLMERLEHAIHYAKRHPENPFAVLFLDLDHFKVINDSLGHTLGDELLVQFGRRLQSSLRASDTIARLGGDEFVVLLEDVRDEAAVAHVAGSLQEALRKSFQIQGREVFTTVSIGIVAQTLEYTRAEDLLRDADIALNHAKAEGKARYVIFSADLRSRAITRLELEGELRQAIDREEFQLYYQPIYSLESRQVTAFEALIRWNHPTRGLLSPGAFINVAEETGLILPIGRWVLHHACAQMSRWHRLHPDLQKLSINVNVASKQLAQPDFVEEVKEALLASGLNPETLRLEITENAVIQNHAMVSGFFTRLSQMGVQLQVDDFGTGYSSLSYLQHFPIQCIKIDRSFIQEIGRPGKNSNLVRTMILMAQDLGMEAIAEGIETDEQLRVLQELECQGGQGFLLAKPMDEKSAERMILAGGRPRKGLFPSPSATRA